MTSCISVLWYLEVGSGDGPIAARCWPLASQPNGIQVTAFPTCTTLSSFTTTTLSQPFPVLKNTSHNDAGGLPFPTEFGMAASPRRTNFAFSESPSSSSCNSDESFRVEDSDTDYDELIPVCKEQPVIGPSSNTQSTSKRMPIPIVKNSVALHNITRPNPSFLAQEEDLSSSPSSPSRQHPLERHPRSQLSRNSKSKRFAFVPPPLPPMPHSATSFHNDIDSPTTPTAPCFAEGEAFYSNQSFHSFDSSPNSSTENLATRTQSVIVAKSHRPSSLNPNPRHLSYCHSSNNLNDAKNAADADVKKQTGSRSSMVGKSRLKAAAALVTPVQIPKTPLETRKSLMSPLSAGPVLMTPDHRLWPTWLPLLLLLLCPRL
ncbi:hypothetical protein B0O80DRAFT_431088 [Mortierella sp. GBAus27b]|nr:hypothetical protein B0O80DRAFT_431088 [Mortierella sp. GBAus27b]